MNRPEDLRLDALSVDVRSLLDRSVASLYSHLVTRPTGRAVRLAIEEQIKDLGTPALSLIDLSSVAILDYSCADEVVAKLLLSSSDRARGTFFLLRGVRPHHRDPIRAVLERHGLAVVAETGASRFELMGSGSDGERVIWLKVEEAGWIRRSEIDALLGGVDERGYLDTLVERRLLFRHPDYGHLYALSRLIEPPE
jgi:anti-anti-sigma regulatory factor